MLLLRPFSITLVTLFFFQASASACGFWEFSDLEAKRSLKFLVNSIEMNIKGKADPRFMKTTSNRAFFTNGDRVKYTANGKVELLRYQGLRSSGKRVFKKEFLGTFSDSSLTLTRGEKISLKVKGESEIGVYLGKPLVGKGAFQNDCFKSSSLKNEMRRILSYYIWKSLKIDPLIEPVANWWW